MYRNRKTGAMLLALVMTLALSGCALSDKLVTDTGSGKQHEIAKEDYLNTEALKNQGEQSIEDFYKILTLEKSTFEETALNQILSREFINVPTVRLDLEGVTAYFGEYLVEYMQYVEVGDVVATVYTEVDELALEEARIKLQRLQERYQRAQVQAAEELQDILTKRAELTDTYEQQLMDLQYHKKQLNWENSKYNYERQIADASEQLTKLTQVGDVYEVKTDIAGYVAFSSAGRYANGSRSMTGMEMQENAYICHILEGNQVYTTTTEQADQFYYGMKVNFDNNNGLTPAVVVSGGNWLTYGNLDSEQAIFRLDFEQDMAELDQTGLNNLVLKGNLKTVENVIVIPRAAVETEGDEYFVTVLKEDGSLLKTEFIQGGSNVESYWVLDGLTEGMRIVYN